jgi:hypothetical protein
MLDNNEPSALEMPAAVRRKISPCKMAKATPDANGET